MEDDKNFTLDIPVNDYKNQFFKRFKELCGFFENKASDIRRTNEAVSCFYEYVNSLTVKTVYSFFSRDILDKKNIYIDKYFYSELLKANIYKFIVFALCVNTKTQDEKNMFGKNILKEFYFNLTLSAAVDVSRNILKNTFENRNNIKYKNLFVSNAFGPGFFGMSHKEVFSLFKLLDCGKIGLFIDKYGTLHPDKSFIGFFAVSKEKIVFKNNCKNCIGNKNNCLYCEKCRFDSYNMTNSIHENNYIK